MRSSISLGLLGAALLLAPSLHAQDAPGAFDSMTSSGSPVGAGPIGVGAVTGEGSAPVGVAMGTGGLGGTSTVDAVAGPSREGGFGFSNLGSMAGDVARTWANPYVNAARGLGGMIRESPFGQRVQEALPAAQRVAGTTWRIASNPVASRLVAAGMTAQPGDWVDLSSQDVQTLFPNAGQHLAGRDLNVGTRLLANDQGTWDGRLELRASTQVGDLQGLFQGSRLGAIAGGDRAGQVLGNFRNMFQGEPMGGHMVIDTSARPNGGEGPRRIGVTNVGAIIGHPRMNGLGDLPAGTHSFLISDGALSRAAGRAPALANILGTHRLPMPKGSGHMTIGAPHLAGSSAVGTSVRGEAGINGPFNRHGVNIWANPQANISVTNPETGDLSVGVAGGLNIQGYSTMGGGPVRNWLGGKIAGVAQDRGWSEAYGTLRRELPRTNRQLNQVAGVSGADLGFSRGRFGGGFNVNVPQAMHSMGLPGVRLQSVDVLRDQSNRPSFLRARVQSDDLPRTFWDLPN